MLEEEEEDKRDIVLENMLLFIWLGIRCTVPRNKTRGCGQYAFLSALAPTVSIIY